MVYHFSVLRDRRRKISLALLFLLAVHCVTGCTLLQPQKEELAGDYLSVSTDAMYYQISVDIMTEDLAFYYTSDVYAQGADAQWSGTATVFYMQTYFTQECETYCSEGLSFKEWRGCYTKSESSSPSLMISSWIEAVHSGSGYLQKRPVVPEDLSDAFSELTRPAYRISLQDVPIPWSQLCDAHPDSLFGGEELFQLFPNADVDLFFDTYTKELLGITIYHHEDSLWLSASIQVNKSSVVPVIPDVPETDLREAYLNEEWTMKRFDLLEPADPTFPTVPPLN